MKKKATPRKPKVNLKNGHKATFVFTSALKNKLT